MRLVRPLNGKPDPKWKDWEGLTNTLRSQVSIDLRDRTDTYVRELVRLGFAYEVSNWVEPIIFHIEDKITIDEKS